LDITLHIKKGMEKFLGKKVILGKVQHFGDRATGYQYCFKYNICIYVQYTVTNILGKYPDRIRLRYVSVVQPTSCLFPPSPELELGPCTPSLNTRGPRRTAPPTFPPVDISHLRHAALFSTEGTVGTPYPLSGRFPVPGRFWFSHPGEVRRTRA
jgi:hypothetical protein